MFGSRISCFSYYLKLPANSKLLNKHNNPKRQSQSLKKGNNYEIYIRNLPIIVSNIYFKNKKVFQTSDYGVYSNIRLFFN